MAFAPPARHLLRNTDRSVAEIGLSVGLPGIDSGFRDPSGNSLRLTEVKLPAEV